MKSADLIPIILRELNDGDKYGYEIIKNIESKSENKIQIKQPALYTILKKLESSKFISSYWEDSDIGGKRHYFKISDNGKKQLETFPAYDILIDLALKAEKNEKPTKINKDEIEKVVTQSDDLDLKTVHQINVDNIIEADNKQESVATVEQTTFMDSDKNKISTEYKNELKSIYENVPTTLRADLQKKDVRKSTLPKPTQNLSPIFEPVKSFDYYDFKNDKANINAENICKASLYKTIIFSVALWVELILLFVISRATGYNKLFDIYMFFACVVALAYPTVFAFFYKDMKLKYIDGKFYYDIKKNLIIRSIIVGILLALVLILNITGATVIGGSMFGIKNFVNFYAPIVLISNILFEHLLCYLFFKNLV